MGLFNDLLIRKYKKPEEPEYFYIENLTSSSQTIGFENLSDMAPVLNLEYSEDKINWTSFSTSPTQLDIPVSAKGKVYFRGNNDFAFTRHTEWSAQSNEYPNYIYIHFNSEVGGNIMSLLDKEMRSTTIYDYQFFNLFHTSTGIKSIANLILPATTLAKYCYQGMFNGCTGLTTISSNLLPATTLADNCYNSMFRNTSLNTIPSNLLPATTLAKDCYASMFMGTSINTIPSNLLPSTSLFEGCYNGMFANCRELTSVPANLLPSTTLKKSCYYSMFSGCTSLTVAPELPATTTIIPECYNNMFNGCSSLNYIKCLSTNSWDPNYTYNWVRGVSSTGTFIKSSSQSTTRGDYAIPSGWTIINNT